MYRGIHRHYQGIAISLSRNLLTADHSSHRDTLYLFIDFGCQVSAFGLTGFRIAEAFNKSRRSLATPPF